MKVLRNEAIIKCNWKNPSLPPCEPLNDDKLRELSAIIAANFGDTHVTPEKGICLVGDLEFVLIHGWQINVEVDSHIAHEQTRYLTLQADQGGGSYANVKMNTLRQFGANRTYATGGDSLDKIQEMVRQHIAKCTGVPAERIPTTLENTEGVDGFETALSIIQMSNPKANKLQRNQHDWLKNHLQYTNFLGGIQVPITFRDVPKDKASGWLRVSVSGAAEWQDLALAIMLADYPLSSIFNYEVDFEPLTKVSTDAHFLMQIMGIYTETILCTCYDSYCYDN